MKLRNLITVLEGRENLELHIDGRQLHFTAKNAQPEWMVREIESVQVNPQFYLGLTIRIKDEDKTIEIDCPRCNGTGKIKHECNEYDCKVIKEIYSRSGTYSGESLCIRRCSICGKLFKVRGQWDEGTGDDDIWLEVGEKKRGYSFTKKEAEAALREYEAKEQKRNLTPSRADNPGRKG